MGDDTHFCAACGAECRAFARYPWHMCQDCCEQAVDHAGRKLNFANESVGGGFVFSIEGVEGLYACAGVLCKIRGRPVRVQEARFGGVVAEPWTGQPASADRLVDLCNLDPDFSALRRVDVRSGRSGGTGPMAMS